MNLPLKQNLRFKLISILIISLGIGLASVGGVLYFQYQSFLLNRVKGVLQQFLELSRHTLDISQVQNKNLTYLKTFVDKTGEIVGCRFTVISVRGEVLADSEIPISQLASIENHLLRPEVQESIEKGVGFSIRHSATVGKDLLYLSTILEKGGETIGFLRGALYAEETNKMLSTARSFFISGGIIILIVSAFLVFILSRKISRNIKEVTEKAHQIAAGNLSVKINTKSNDELSELGESLNEMSLKLSNSLRKLARERNDLSTVLSSIHEGIIAISPDKRVVFFNERVLQLLAEMPENAIGELYYHVIRDQHLKSLLDSFFKKPFLISDEVQLENDRILEVVISPFTLQDSPQKGVVTVLRDISQFKKLEKIRKDFVANVSHEFKTPLAAIRGYSETLLDWGLEDASVNRKYVEKIVKQSHQLENLVSDLLQLARIERLQGIELKAFDPNPLIQDVLNEYLEIARAKHQNLNNDLAQNQLQILGEPEMFRSILANLVDNALKYTPEGGSILVFSRKNDQYCEFAVKDSGIGIPDEEKGRIFERFYRVDKARSHAIEGTGLGLSIVKHLSELQQAEISLESQQNSGTCISVKFKLANYV